MSIHIVVLQRGWVVVGDISTHIGTIIKISGASVIRRWGTTTGLGEIALGGPTDRTILDYAGVVRCHELGIVFMLDCVEEKWKLHIK